MILITELFSVTLGQAVAALSPSIFVAALFNPFLLVIFSLFCGEFSTSKEVVEIVTDDICCSGVTIPYPNLTYFWRQWLYWVCRSCPAPYLHPYTDSSYAIAQPLHLARCWFDRHRLARSSCRLRKSSVAFSLKDPDLTLHSTTGR